MVCTEWKDDTDEAVDGEEGEEEDRCLAAQECDKASYLADDARSPLLGSTLPEVRITYVEIHSGKDDHVGAHQEVGKGQIGDED